MAHFFFLSGERGRIQLKVRPLRTYLVVTPTSAALFAKQFVLHCVLKKMLVFKIFKEKHLSTVTSSCACMTENLRSKKGGSFSEAAA